MLCCLEMDNTPRADFRLIPVTFGDGPLGVTLRRRVEDGVVFVFDIVENSQAVGMDIDIGDELWAIGMSEIGDVALDKEAWNGLVQYIKFSPRPLKAVWKRVYRYPAEGSIADENEDVRPDTENENEEQSTVLSSIRSPILSPPIPDSEKSRDTVQPPRKPDKPEKPERPDNPFRHEKNERNERPEKPDRNEKSERNEKLSNLKSVTLSNDDSDIMELSAKLIMKDKEKPSFANGFASKSKRDENSPTINLLKEGRKILKMGELETTTKAALAMWATQNKRQFILLTDILIIAIAVGQSLQVEHMIDLQICKIYCEGQNSSDYTVNQSTSDKGVSVENCFQLLWPGGTLQIVAKNTDEKENWVESISTAIYEGVDVDSQRVLGWRHQYMLGSMHAAVISRDEGKVKDLINKCESGLLNFSVIDSVDEDGYTPLHYACILRLSSIIRVLHATGSDVSVEDSSGLTALHWSALQLDNESLTILCQHIVDIDVLDRKGRTPLYLACVEGRDVSGRTDTKNLTACVLTMLNNGADCDYRDEQGYSILHYLAASWQHEPLKAILDDKTKPNIFKFSGKDGMNALHYACDASPLKRSIGEGSRILSHSNKNSNRSGKNDNGDNGDGGSDSESDVQVEHLNIEDGMPTLIALLKSGSRQNVRDGRGRSPLQLLAESSDVWGNRFGEAVDTLLSFGARMEGSGCKEIKESNQVSIEESQSEWLALQAVDADYLAVLKTPMSRFKDLDVKSPSSIPESTGTNKQKEQKEQKEKEKKELKDKEKDKVCSLCDFKFSMFKRQHHCRMCDCVCCDDCSKKKSIVEEAQVRCCDSCFNYLSSEVEIQRYHTQKNKERNPISPILAKGSKAVKKEKDLKELLGNAIMKNKDNGKDEKNAVQNSQSGVSGAMSSMSEAHERLMERGEKLNRMTDKSAEVSNAAEEFAKLAKQLNEQNKSRWF